MLLLAKAAALALFVAVSSLAPQQAPAPQSTLVIQGLGRGAVEIDGDWQFHLGDDLRWASPSFDDSGWEPITTSSSWGSQGHSGYTGFAWYRRHVQINRVPGFQSSYALLIPPVDDAYELYWDGKLIGTYGRLPPRPSWYYSSLFRTFPLPSEGSGVLALRVWKSPALFVDSGALGGMTGPPLLGDVSTIAAQMAAIDSASTQQVLYDYTLIVLYGFVTLLGLLLWSRDRASELLLWLAIFTVTPIILAVLQGLFPAPIPYTWGRGLNQPIYVLNHISLWFLLLWLLKLSNNRRLVRWTWGLAIGTLASGVLDGALAFFWGHAHPWMQVLDATLTAIILSVEVFPFVIIAIGMRQRLDASRWLFALSALVSQMIDTVADVSAEGQRFTHWTLFETIDTPLFTIHGIVFRAAKLATLVLFISILYAVYRYTMERQARQRVLEGEMQGAREIQQMLIPDTLPSVEGFAITSAYQPALDVGGDFFQIIPESEGSTIVALGDVSGKGLGAAMNVSLVMGILRSLGDANFDPVQMLETLSRCLCGRLQDGFATGIILRLRPDGAVTIANAGHLPPFLNEQELEMDGSLPLGLLASASYTEISIRLQPGDQLSLYTDGLLEARSASGELYGFDRLRALLASRPTAEQATQVAVAFGQSDDITVLTLTRLAAGEPSTTSLSAPVLTPTEAQVGSAAI